MDDVHDKVGKFSCTWKIAPSATMRGICCARIRLAIAYFICFFSAARVSVMPGEALCVYFVPMCLSSDVDDDDDHYKGASFPSNIVFSFHEGERKNPSANATDTSSVVDFLVDAKHLQSLHYAEQTTCSLHPEQIPE